MYHDKFVQDIVDKLKEVEGLQAIVVGVIGCDNQKLDETLSNTQTLLSEVIELCRDQYTPKFTLR